MSAALKAAPKSICSDVAAAVLAKLTEDGIVDYKKTVHVYKNDSELSDLRASIKAVLSTKHNSKYGEDAAALLNLKEVNAFLKKNHVKNQRTPAQVQADKDHVALNNASTKLRKQRKKTAADEAESSKIQRAQELQAKATHAEDTVVQSAREWFLLLYDCSDTSKPVANTDVVLLLEDEHKLNSLHADIDKVYAELRGAASIESGRCREVIITLEKLMKYFRAHPAVNHLSSYSSIPEKQVAETAPEIVPIISRRHRGAQKGSGGNKWKVGDPTSLRKGGLKFTNGALKSRKKGMERKLKQFHELLYHRVEQEEHKNEQSKRKKKRKSLRLLPETAKNESKCPTSKAELSNEQLKEAIEMQTQELGDLLQEKLQRENNANEGAALMELPTGTSMILISDPSALNKDLFGGYGVGSRNGRLFSTLMSKASHDERQYNKETGGLAKKSKYYVDERVIES